MLAHYIQTVMRDEMLHFDYDAVGNILKYGQIRPPRVPFEKVNSTTIAAFVSSDDALADKRDLQIFKRTIPLLDYYKVPYDMYSHLDFIFGMQNGRLLIPRILQILDNYYSRSD